MKSIYYTDDNDAGEDYQNSWWPWWIFVFNIICNQPLRTWQGASCWFFHIKVPLLFSASSSFPLSPWSSDPSQPVRLWMGEDSVDRRSPLSVPTLLTRAAEVFLLHLLLLWQIFFYIFIICFLSLIFIKSKRKQVMLFCWKWKDIEKFERNFFFFFTGCSRPPSPDGEKRRFLENLDLWRGWVFSILQSVSSWFYIVQSWTKLLYQKGPILHQVPYHYIVFFFCRSI